MPALVNIRTDLTSLRAKPKPYNQEIYAFSSNLVELKTNLTELKFGNDQPGYGSSGLPYIQTKIPTASPAAPGINPIYRPGAPGSSDYPIRGGAIEFQIGQQTYTLSSQIDQTRIRKFFEDKQRGTLFIQKQIGLQLSNPKMEVGNTLFGLGQSAPVPGLLEITRVYNRGVNTLAQVGVAGTGAHAVRHGLTPFNLAQKNYFAIVNSQNVNNEKITNRLLNLNALKMTTGASPFVNPQNVLDIETVNKLGISLNRNVLFQYLGGPGSAYGIGATTIKRAVDTTKLKSSNAMSYDKIKAQTINSTVKEDSKKKYYDIQDYRTWEEGKDNQWRGIDYRFYVKDTRIDKLNTLYPFVIDTAGPDPWQYDKYKTDDLIKFGFEAISNEAPSLSQIILFRAFLNGSITDNNSATWNSFKYIGRGENFYTYQGFDRSIGFSFKIAAQSKEEMRPMYNRLNSLMSQVYPDYSEVGSIMRGPLIRLTIGDYIYRMPGFLENVNVTIDGGTPWEINLDNDIAQLPQAVDVSVSFKPIPDYLPQRAKILGPVNRTDATSKLANESVMMDQAFATTETYTGAYSTNAIIVNNKNINFINGTGEKGVETAASIYRQATREEAQKQLSAEGYDVELMNQYR